MRPIPRMPRLGLLLLIPVLVAGILPAQEKKDADRDHPYERQQWFMRGRMVNGHPGAAELNRAYRQKMAKRAQRARVSAAQTMTVEGAQGAQSGSTVQSITSTATPNGNVWTALGPAPAASSADSSQDYGPVVGRITSVVVDQGDATGNTVYIGGATGGVWRSYNAANPAHSCTGTGVCNATAVTWTPLTDSQVTTTIGAIGLQPGGSGPCSSGQPSACAQVILVGTGEANSAADSYYGQGFLRSTDGGASWSNITTASIPSSALNSKFSSKPCGGGAQVSAAVCDLTGIGFLKVTFSSLNPSVVVAAGASSSIGPDTGAQLNQDARLGMYFSSDAGATWTKATVTDSTGVIDAGSVTDIVFDPTANKFYAAFRYHGMFSSADGGQTWQKLAGQPDPSRIPTGGTDPCPASITSSCKFYRAALSLVPNRSFSGNAEIYAFIVDNADGDQGIYQTTNGGVSWAAVPNTASTLDNCSAPYNDGSGNGCGTDQGDYNLTLAAVPNGSATDLYAGAVNEYKCTLTSSGAGAVPSPASCSFINLTHVYGCDASAGTLTSNHVHPDEHGIDFAIGTQTIYFGNDGGIYRVLNGTQLTNGACPTAVTNSQFDNLNGSMGSMLQFVSFSQDPSDPSILLGGTQDNGSPKKDQSSPATTYGFAWGAAHIGDGGYSAINPNNRFEWLTTYAYLPIQRCVNTSLNPTSCNDATFTDDITSTKAGGDSTTFYPVYVFDPQPINQIVLGTCRIWRGASDASSGWAPGGTPLSNNFDTGTNTQCAKNQGNMISAVAAGGPKSTSNQASQVIYAGTEGTPPDSSTGTPGNGGQLFVTLAADTASAGGSCTGTGVNCPGNGWSNATAKGSGACTAVATACNINPSHYNISGAAIDPSDTTGHTAYVTVMGFHTNHVLKTTDGGNTWAALDGDPNNGGLPDAPANSVIVHPNIAGQIYVGTDVGVFGYDPADKIWYEVNASSGSALPNVPVTHLEIFKGSPYKLRASTYGRGIWETIIPSSAAPNFLINLSSSSLTIYPSGTATGKTTASFSGTVTFLNNSNNAIPSVTLSCGSGAPATCTPATVTPAANSFSIPVANLTAGNFSFQLTGVGGDAAHTTNSIPVTVYVVDFAVSAPSPSSVSAKNGNPTQSIGLTLNPTGPLNTSVVLACTNLPSDVTCSFTPPSANVQDIAVPVSLIINAGPLATPATYNIGITASTADGLLTHPTATEAPISVSLQITANKSFQWTRPLPTIPLVKVGQKTTPPVALTLASQDGFVGTVALTCMVTGPLPAPTCGLSTTQTGTPAMGQVVSLTSGGSLPIYLTVDGASAAAGSGTITIHGATSDPVDNATPDLALAYTIGDFVITNPSPIALLPGGSGTAAFRVTSNYSANLSISPCVASDPSLSCSGPSNVSVTAGTPATINATVNATSNAPAGDRQISFTVSDGSLSHPASATIRVQDFSFPAPSATSVTIKAGAATGNTLTFNFSPVNGLSGTLKITCSAGLPSKASCSFTNGATLQGDPATFTLSGPTQVTLAFNTTAATATLGAPPLPRRGAPLFAFYFGVPAVVIGMVSTGKRTSRKRWVLLAMVVALLIAMAACGGGGGSSSTPPPTPVPGTPAGSYTVTVSASVTSGSSTLTHTQQVTLVVQ